eukprot:1205-Pelagococcus_subviridis.AAC.1
MGGDDRRRRDRRVDRAARGRCRGRASHRGMAHGLRARDVYRRTHSAVLGERRAVERAAAPPPGRDAHRDRGASGRQGRLGERQEDRDVAAARSRLRLVFRRRRRRLGDDEDARGHREQVLEQSVRQGAEDSGGGDGGGDGGEVRRAADRDRARAAGGVARDGRGVAGLAAAI